MNIPDSSPCITGADRRWPVLFLDKVFLKPRKTNLRGVELFNLSLIQDLARDGFQLTIPIHYSWKDDFRHGLSSCRPVFCEVSGRGTLLNGLIAAWRLRRQQHPKIILANVANGLIPALLFLRIFNRPVSPIIFAHRMPSIRFMAVLAKKTTRVICVNSIIAARFMKAGFMDVSSFFGHINADKFYPPAGNNGSKRQVNLEDGGGASADSSKINFCVVGFLDNAWKGADTAVAAFRAMLKHVSAKCVLHLASYRSPPSFPEDNIKVYKWMPAGEMPGWLRQMDVMIVPSRDEHVMRETFSLTMIEGMLTGLPLIVSNLPVLAEKLDAGGGYVFNDINELARLMTLLATQPQLRDKLGKEARQTALERYVWNTGKFINRYLV